MIRRENVFKSCYFFLMGLNDFPPHPLQCNLPCAILMFCAFIFAEQLLQTNTFLNNLISASGNLTITQHPLPVSLPCPSGLSSKEQSSPQQPCLSARQVFLSQMFHRFQHP